MFKRTIVILLLCFAGIMLVTAFFTASAAPGVINESTIAEYAIPTATGGPQSIAVQAPGHVWFTLPQENAIGKLVVTSTVDYDFTIHPLPTAGSEPYDLVYDGRFIWFTERAGNKLGQFDTLTHILTETVLTPADSLPTSIAMAPNGSLWLTKPGASTGNISRYDPATMTFQNYTYSKAGTPTAVPHEITVINNTLIAFTVPTINAVIELDLDPTTVFKEIILNTVVGDSFPPGGLTSDGQSVWVSAPTKSWVGRHVPGTLSNFLWLNLASNTAAPTSLFYKAAGGFRQIWYVGTESSHMGNVVVDADGRKVSSLDFILPDANSLPTDIAVDANDHAWITESGSNKIAEWRPPYTVPVYLPLITK